MFEVTISTQQSSEFLLERIERTLESILQQIDGIGTDVFENGRRYYSLACSDTYRFQLQRHVAQSVAEIMSSAYKNEFVRNCLGIQKGTFMQDVLINTMCVFDKKVDQQTICKLVDTEKPICLDGYCNFRFVALKNKWKEIALLVSENNYILRDEQLILEFLQYLLESVECGCSNLSVSMEEKDFFLYNDKDEVLPVIESMAKESTVEKEAALNILLLNPRKITVYHTAKISDDFCKILQSFDCKFIKTE